MTSSIMNSQSHFDSLPDELIVEIIQRPPQKYVHRYRCVSKRWLNITTSRSFIKSYIDYNTCSPNYKPPFALFYQQISDIPYPYHSKGISSCAFLDNADFKSTGYSLDFLGLSFPLHNEQPNVLSWSNGLLLCSSHEFPRGRYYVCNPLTKHWITIPPPPSYKYCSYIGFVCKSTNNGCSFRIVRVSLQESNENYVKLQTYNSELEDWTQSIFKNTHGIMNFPTKSFRQVQATSAIECNGLLHFKNEASSIFVYDPYTAMNTGKIIKVPIQSFIPRLYGSSTIGACNGRIMYAHRDFDRLSVWKLEDYEMEKWSLVQEFRLRDMESEYAQNLEVWFASLLVEFHPFDEDIIFLHLRCQILSCDMVSKKLTTVCQLASPENLLTFPITLPWWPESLH